MSTNGSLEEKNQPRFFSLALTLIPGDGRCTHYLHTHHVRTPAYFHFHRFTNCNEEFLCFESPHERCTAAVVPGKSPLAGARVL